jgi:FAD/FMN-containing dehydrogenase
MRNLSVDPEKRTVVAQGGCLAGDIYRATEPHDLVFGTSFQTRNYALTASWTHGSGSRNWGIDAWRWARIFDESIRVYPRISGVRVNVRMTIDTILSAQVVLASGDIVIANEIENPDLFWAIRGTTLLL